MSTLALIVAVSLAAPPSAAAPAVDGADAFARVKQLEGSWKAEAKDTAAFVTVRLVAGGTAVLETVTGADRTEVTSVTVYALEGKELIATHHAASGVTRLRAKALGADALSFEPVSKEPRVLGLSLVTSGSKLRQEWALRVGYREEKQTVALLREYVDTLK